MLPPVAAAVKWEEAMRRAMVSNKGTERPTSYRSLSRALAAISEPTAESWKRQLNKIKADDKASEEHAQLIAQALGVPRPALPPAARPSTKGHLERRLAALEETAVRVEDLGRVERVLRGAIESLAKGDAQGALRVLSELDDR